MNRYTPPLTPRRDPLARAHYAGLGRRERTLIACCNAAALLAALALLLFGKPASFPAPADPMPISIFDVQPPPPPPPPPEKEQAKSRLLTIAKPAAAAGGRKASPPPVSAPAPILAAAPPSPLIQPEVPPTAAAPEPGTGDGSDGTGQGSGQGSDNGAGGSGGGVGNGDGADRFARADWIEKPTRTDFQREWPQRYRHLDAEVQVLVACYVKPSGRPHRCKVAWTNRPGDGFGRAAIRLVQGARVKPVSKNGQAMNLPVLAPIAFWPTSKASAATAKEQAKAK